MKKVVSVLVAAAMAASMSVFAMTASATKDGIDYVLPVDDMDSWIAEIMEPYQWGGALAECDVINGEVVDGAMKLTMGGGWQYPHARVEDMNNGLVAVTEDDYVNLDISLDTTEQDIRFGLTLVCNLDTKNTNVQLAPYICKLAGVTPVGTGTGEQVPGGDYKLSFKFVDAVKYLDEIAGSTVYDSLFGADGDSTVCSIRFYLYSSTPEDVADKALTIRSFTIGAEASDTDTSTGSGTNSTASTSGNTSTGGNATTSSKTSTAGGGKTSSTQVTTGENLIPVIGVAALAVVATSTVIISKKRSK